ncbi:MAG: response regulator [Caldilineaceae bacterium]
MASTGEPYLSRNVNADPRYIALAGSRTQSELVLPIKSKGQIIGVLDVQEEHANAFDDVEVTVLQSLANQAGVAIENARLYERARQLAVLEERQRLARDLHDSVTQALYGATLYAEAAARLVDAGKTEIAAEHLRNLRDTTHEALGEMRLLIFELRPSILESEGLVAALHARLEAVEGRTGLNTEISVDGVAKLPADVEEGLYWISQEVLNNTLKHAKATHVTVKLQGARETMSATGDPGQRHRLRSGRSSPRRWARSSRYRRTRESTQRPPGNAKPTRRRHHCDRRSPRRSTLLIPTGAHGSMSNSIRILITDDHVVVRRGTQALLATEPEIEVVGEAKNGEEAVAKALQFQPDVILMDLEMPVMDGIEAIRRITASRPDARILVLTSFATDDKVFPAIKAGRAGLPAQRFQPRRVGARHPPGPPRRIVAASHDCTQAAARDVAPNAEAAHRGSAYRTRGRSPQTRRPRTQQPGHRRRTRH